MGRRWSVGLLWLALLAGPAAANETLEPELREIERLGYAAHWRESDERIQALADRQDELSREQRQRLEYVRLRNLGIAGRLKEAVEGFDRLLREEMPAKLKVKAFSTAASIAANLEDWTMAFTWLGEALSYVPEVPDDAPRVLGMASYLHSLVGETDKARELALRGLAMVEESGDQRAICHALSDLALAEELVGKHAESGRLRRRQMEVCDEAGDRIFSANARYGVGKMLAAQGRPEEGLAWVRQAQADFEESGFEAGAWSARLVVAECLIATDRELDHAHDLLVDALRYYRERDSQIAVAEAERLLADLAEHRGDPVQALRHLKGAAAASEAAERAARERQLAYLQVEFDTRLKERQIALLEAEKELAALQVTATRRRQWLLAAGVVALLATALLLVVLLHRAFLERRRYRWQSERDSLTGLLNYQQVRRLGQEAFARAHGNGRPFTAIVLDIDWFKEVNDRYGHAAGDEALRALGGWIAEVVEGRGIAGRSGGDEFTILLEGTEEDAGALLDRLRARMEAVSVFGQTVHFSISAGICQDRDSNGTLEHLVHEADQALYRAKYAGRDRTVCAGDTAPQAGGGGLVVVGSGIEFGRHISERCLSEIREAQVVFCLTDPFSLAMVQGLRPDAINLGAYYAEGKDRRITYREIDDAIMAQVRAGKRVCAVFYGHPGVFADVPHAVIRKARAEGIRARMEPGISAEACLYADLGIDPGRRGVQSMEATHFLHYGRVPDTAGLVLLWQVALSGDLSCSRFHPEREGLQALVDRLLRWYPADHEVILYEAARLPIQEPRIERLALQALPDAHYEEYTTLVIPPLGDLEPVDATGPAATGTAG